ncbi:hypothetical protein V6N13_107742 [Hibiscus sabdariffa]
MKTVGEIAEEGAGRSSFLDGEVCVIVSGGMWTGQILMGFMRSVFYAFNGLLRAETQVVMFRDKSVDHDTIVVCFRGTQLFSSDVWCSYVDLFWFQFAHIGKIHSGSKFIVAGHSLGGTLAALFPAILLLPQGGVLSGENASGLHVRSTKSRERYVQGLHGKELEEARDSFFSHMSIVTIWFLEFPLMECSSTLALVFTTTSNINPP